MYVVLTVIAEEILSTAEPSMEEKYVFFFLKASIFLKIRIASFLYMCFVVFFESVAESSSTLQYLCKMSLYTFSHIIESIFPAGVLPAGALCPPIHLNKLLSGPATQLLS